MVLLPVVVCKSFGWSGVAVSAGGQRCWRAVGCVPSPRSFGEEGTKCRCARRSAVQGTVKEIGARSLRRAAICFAKALARSEAGLMLPPASSRKERGAGRRLGSVRPLAAGRSTAPVRGRPAGRRATPPPRPEAARAMAGRPQHPRGRDHRSRVTCAGATKAAEEPGRSPYSCASCCRPSYPAWACPAGHGWSLTAGSV